LIDPIVLFEGMILDGRNRAAACERAGVAPRYVQFGGGREDALILVVSHNIKRRHLTKQAVADALVAAEDFNLHYTLAEPAAKKESPEEAADAPGQGERPAGIAGGGEEGANWRAGRRQGGRSVAGATKGHCRVAKTEESGDRGR